MTAATGLRRLGTATVAVVIAGTGVLFGANFLVSADAVRNQVKTEIRAVTGLDPVLRGKTTVSLFPSAFVSFADVLLGDAAQPALTARRLTAHLRFFPLLVGHVEIADISLERPNISIDLEPNGHSNWSGLVAALVRSRKPEPAQLAAFSEIRIDHGTVALHERAHKFNETLEDVEFSLAWPSISKSFGATGHFVWHDEPMDASLTLSDFAAALNGGPTGLKLRVSGMPIKAAFDGSISVKPTVKIDGTLAVDTASLRNALIWTGEKPLPGGGFGRFSLKAHTNVVGGTINLSNVNVDLDGNSAEGVLTFATDGRQALQGTLAADRLDLTPYISTVRLLTANPRGWSNGPINLDGLSGVDLDLRLSAAKVILSDAKLGRTAIAANLRDGNLVVTVGESQAYNGIIKGSFALADFNSGAKLKGQMQFTDVDLEPCLDQIFGLHRLEGKGNIAFSIEGSGNSVLAVTRTLNGTASLQGHKGVLTGLNIEHLLRRLKDRPLSAGDEFRSGRTPYDKIAVSMKIVNGKVSVDDVTIEGPAVKLALSGSASIPNRELDLKGSAGLIPVANQKTPAFELPFIVQGSWDDPLMLPDVEALIRRSDAAAPLLKAMHDRRAGSTVRSVIQRLTGGSPTAAAPEAEAKAPPPELQGTIDR
ncbi:MAG TPA: AsmA family protein [Pseudolabrys sp.]|nr:AsmA family protein [Pseudolabrys sp.]